MINAAEQIRGKVEVAEGNCSLNEHGRTRQAFLKNLFKLFDDCAVRYCVLHSWDDLPDSLTSDLDIAVHPGDQAKLAEAICGLRAAGYEPIQCFHYSVGAFYFVFTWPEPGGPGFTCIDMLFEHWRGGQLVAKADDIIASRKWRNGFWTSDARSEASYLLAKRAWKGASTAAQAQRVTLLAQTLGADETGRIADDLFLRPWSQKIAAACIDSGSPFALKRLGCVLRLTAIVRHPLRLVRFVARDVHRRVQRWIRPTGMMIAVLGTDGAGKSTLIEQLHSRFAPAFRRRLRFHWAPRLIVPQRTAAPTTDPHGKPSRGPLLSSGALFAVVVDYWIACLVSLKQSRARSGLILFDRYFHDALVDPKRYRYGGPAWLARWMARLVPSPDLVVILDADERVIADRKAEISPDEISRQRKRYKELRFAKSERIVVNTERGTDSTLEEVSAAIIARLARRFESRHPEWQSAKEAW